MQACFLGDVKVIWCNFLGDSHFQTYVMNNVELLIDYYLHITLYVSHALTSCKHITSNSLLNFIHEIVCKLVWPSKIIHFVMFDAKFFKGWFKFLRRKIKNFGLKTQVEDNVFWKFFGIILIYYMSWKIFWKLVLQKHFWFLKKFCFSESRSIKSIFQSIEKC